MLYIEDIVWMTHIKKVHFSDRKSCDFYTGVQSDKKMNLEGIKDIL